MKKSMISIVVLYLIVLIKSNLIAADENIINIVKSLGINDSTTVYDKLELLRKYPDLSIDLLIKELHMIKVSKIVPEVYKKYPKEMHVVWCIRALRYLTGEDFMALTSYKFNKSEDGRNQLLHSSDATSKEVTFFAVRMSHDVVYIAPLDAQKAIIKKWEQWFNKQTKPIKLAEPRSFNDWYF